MFGGNDIIHDPKIVGRTLLGKLDDDLRVKLQFVSTEVHKHYDAIQVSILNRTDGLVDRETMLFGDIIGVKNTNISGRVNPYLQNSPKLQLRKTKIATDKIFFI